MSLQEKHKYAFRLTSVASTGLDFIGESLMRIMNNATDLAYLRPFYLLLSYNFELILKSRVVMLGNFSIAVELKGELQRLGHDIIAIKNELGNANLQEIGIKFIAKDKNKYNVLTTDEKEIYIENFTDVRYDFLDGVMRSVDSEEHKRLKEYTEALLLILKKVKQKNEQDKNKI
ncbi:hypothetical protein HQ544_02885 [Candidatus Falkowbacteria bacterium]|nr:hypothetical protein [Candidatus Falkowbacteria bacterium]